MRNKLEALTPEELDNFIDHNHTVNNQPTTTNNNPTKQKSLPLVQNTAAKTNKVPLSFSRLDVLQFMLFQI
jgi:hypothetical protein